MRLGGPVEASGESNRQGVQRAGETTRSEQTGEPSLYKWSSEFFSAGDSDLSHLHMHALNEYAVPARSSYQLLLLHEVHPHCRSPAVTDFHSLCPDVILTRRVHTSAGPAGSIRSSRTQNVSASDSSLAPHD